MSFLKGMAMVDTVVMQVPQVTIQVVAITPVDTITTQVCESIILNSKPSSQRLCYFWIAMFKGYGYGGNTGYESGSTGGTMIDEQSTLIDFYSIQTK